MEHEDPGLTHKQVLELARLRPKPRREHREIRNINRVIAERLTPGQRAADTVANGMGSWRFIIIQSLLLVVWIALNVAGIVAHWDPYPFILLNLMMSFQAAYAAPIIMMSQNRQGQKDRLAAEHDYRINVTAEAEITAILQHLEYQDELILQILHRMEHTSTDAGAALGPDAHTVETP